MSKQASKQESREPVWLVFEGLTGRDGEFDQLGDHVLPHLELSPLVLQQGLNAPISADLWDAWSRVPAVKNLLDTGALRETSADLSEFAGPGRLRQLIERTTSLEALEHVKRIEDAKPLSGGRGNRRDLGLLEQIERRIAFAQKWAPIDLSGLSTITAQRVAIGVRG